VNPHRQDQPPKCRYCYAPIVFRRTVRSEGLKSMPLDPEPHPLGTIALDGREWAYVYGREDTLTLFPDDDERPDLYRPHFETCPEWPRDRPAFKPRRDTGDGIDED
jgi:hypothetical protein